MLSRQHANCSVCRDLGIVSHEGVKEITKAMLRESISNGCSPCGMIWDIVALHFDWDNVDHLWAHENFHWIRVHATQNDPGGTEINLCLLKSTNAASSILCTTENPQDRRSEHYHVLETLKRRPFAVSRRSDIRNTIKWVEECQNHHDECSQKNVPKLPTRVLDVSTDTPRLFESTNERARYIALSHRWGDETANSTILKTTRANLRSHCSGISFSSLPRTFRHAILICRALNIDYLWIDSLSIIQDDFEDWEREGSVMCDIYQDAFLTISADRTEHSDSGLFRTQEDIQHLRQDIKTLTHTDTRTGVAYQIFSNTRYRGYNSVDKLFCLARESSDLDSRGWVLQERLLSRRCVHFDSQELTWECKRLFKCECQLDVCSPTDWIKRDYLDMNSTFEASPNGPNREGPTGASSQAWMNLVSQYKYKNLTFEKDRLPALAGLAASTGRSPRSYLAGLWLDDLEVQLLWDPVSNNTVPRSVNALPTWSWISVPGPICFRERCTKTFWKIIDAECVRSGLNPFGSVASGTLILQTYTMRIYFQEASDVVPGTTTASAGFFSFWRDARVGEKPDHVLRQSPLRFDNPEHCDNLRAYQASFLIIFPGLWKYTEDTYDDESWPLAMLLKSSETRLGTYERVGLQASLNGLWKDYRPFVQWHEVTIS